MLPKLVFRVQLFESLFHCPSWANYNLVCLFRGFFLLFAARVEPRLSATLVIRSLRYYGYFFWPSDKNDRTFFRKERLVNTVTPLLGPNLLTPR